jgi:23S rRNA (cytidine1920-2'-O)/16S rRNA (cytidine1409-2'-O)-methyltransferase
LNGCESDYLNQSRKVLDNGQSESHGSARIVCRRCARFYWRRGRFPADCRSGRVAGSRTVSSPLCESPYLRNGLVAGSVSTVLSAAPNTVRILVSMDSQFASRGALKLLPILDHYGIAPLDAVVADFGASSGGFVDAWLTRGARKAFAVEKGFGLLDWRLRNDARVVVMERTDVRSVRLPEQVDFMSADVGFTRQMQFVPHLMRYLKPKGVLLSLFKPQYEAGGRDLVKGRLTDDVADRLLNNTITELQRSGVMVKSVVPSPVRGKDAEVQEFFMLIAAA